MQNQYLNALCNFLGIDCNCENDGIAILNYEGRDLVFSFKKRNGMKKSKNFLLKAENKEKLNYTDSIFSFLAPCVISSAIGFHLLRI